MSIDDALKTITPREEMVIRARYGIGEEKSTLQKIGGHFGVTKNRIAQIQLKGLRKLRHPTRIKMINDLIEQYETLGDPIKDLIQGVLEEKICCQYKLEAIKRKNERTG